VKPSTWTKQRDRGVWEAIIKQQKGWRNRIKLHHVESHVNKKKDKQGQRRIPTEIQWMNIAVDEMAEGGYTLEIPPTQAHEQERAEGYKVYITNGTQHGEITGNIRTQILEEIKIQDTKRRVSTKKSEGTWGKDDANIEWRMMRKTLPARTHKERI